MPHKKIKRRNSAGFVCIWDIKIDSSWYPNLFHDQGCFIITLASGFILNTEKMHPSMMTMTFHAKPFKEIFGLVKHTKKKKNSQKAFYIIPPICVHILCSDQKIGVRNEYIVVVL